MTNFFIALLPYIKLGIVIAIIIALSLLTKFILWNGRIRKHVHFIILFVIYTFIVLIGWGIYELFHVLKDKKFDIQYLWYFLYIIIVIGIIWAIVKNWKDFSVWKLLAWILVLSFGLPLCFWVYQITRPNPKPWGYWNSTEGDYKAKDEHSNIGNESFTLGKRPGGGGNSSSYSTISFKERDSAKANIPFYVELDKVGHAYIPSDEGVWRTITRTNVKYPHEYIIFTSKRVGSTLFVKNYSESKFRHNGVWKVVVDKDMEFALRSLSDDRVQIIMQ